MANGNKNDELSSNIKVGAGSNQIGFNSSVLQDPGTRGQVMGLISDSRPGATQPPQSNIAAIQKMGQDRQRQIMLENNPLTHGTILNNIDDTGKSPTLGQMATSVGDRNALMVNNLVGASPTVGAGITGLPPAQAASILGAAPGLSAPRGGIQPGPIAKGDAPAVDLSQFETPLTAEEAIKSGAITGADRRALFSAQGSKDSSVQRKAQSIMAKLEQKRKSAIRKRDRQEKRDFDKTVRQERDAAELEKQNQGIKLRGQEQRQGLQTQADLQSTAALQAGELPLNPETGEVNPAFQLKFDNDLQKMRENGDIQGELDLMRAYTGALLKQKTSVSTEARIDPASGKETASITTTNVDDPASIVSGVRKQGQKTRAIKEIDDALKSGKAPNGDPLTTAQIAELRRRKSSLSR